jgi:amidohydrolase
VSGDLESIKGAARAAAEKARDDLVGLSHRIHAKPELGYEERESAAAVAAMLSAAGFEVRTGVHDLPTAFTARAGSGPLHVVICCEYDALPEIGHACGHNVIAAMSAGAGMALLPVADEAGLTVTVLGTPAEEGGGGKIELLERGAFDGVHAAMMVHPAPFDVVKMPIIAAVQFEARYTGKEAHASAFPELGINAADALVVAQSAIGLLRQHLRGTDRVHGIVTHGGDAPNVVPAHTSAMYMVRAETLEDLDEVRKKVLRCFEAGAVATGATLHVEPVGKAYAEMHHDPDMAAAYERNARELGRELIVAGENLRRAAASTDMGNVSLALPSIHPMIGIDSLPAVNHQPEFTAKCVTETADRAVFDGAVAMAWTAIDLAAPGRVRDRLLSPGA